MQSSGERTGTPDAAAFEAALNRHRAGDLRGAAALYVDLLARDPQNAQLWTNLGAARRGLGQYDAAIGCHSRAIACDPRSTTAQNNLGNALRDAGRYAESRRLAIVNAVGLSAGPPWAVARDLAGMGHWRAARAAYDAAIEQKPEDAELRLLRASVHFMLGDFEAGFADYRARFAHSPQSEPKRRSPRWKGGDGSGRRLLVIAEQGLGDMIMVSRFLPLIRARWPEIWLAARAPTVRLFEGLAHVDRVFDRAAMPEEGAEDAHVPSMDLMEICGLTPQTCPPPAPLTIPEESRDRARTLLAPFAPLFRVGICWAGSPTFVQAARKAADLHRFLDLARIPGVQLFGLTKGEAEQDIARLGLDGLILNVAAGDRDLADTAAVIEGLDLVVSVDTAVAHLAASLGKPTWMLTARPCFWYWGARGEASWWYPSLRVIRQARVNDWDAPFATVKAELESLVL